MRVWRPEKSHILRLCFSVDNRHSHLIERAAARLAATETNASQSKPAPDTPARVVQDALAEQPPALHDPHLDQASAKASAPKIDANHLKRAGLVDESNSRIADELRIVQNRILRQSFAETGITGVRSPNL